jgi:hypothetical protein
MQPKIKLTLPTELVLWVKSLKMVPVEQWAPEVRVDFESCLGVEAEEWLKTHYYLWNGPVPSRTRPRQIDAEGSLITVRIDVTAPDKLIHERIQSLIDLQREEIQFTAGKGRQPYQPRQGKYRFAARPDTEAWEVALKALELRTKFPNEPLWGIGLKVTKEYSVGAKLKVQEDGPDRRKELASMASRYIKRAKQICADIASGTYK